MSSSWKNLFIWRKTGERLTMNRSNYEILQVTSDGSALSLIILFYMFGFIVTSSVLLNSAALFFMMKDKDLRRHSQYLMFMIISSTEIVIDIFYLCLFYWNRTFVHFCHVLLVVLIIGRNNVFFHLMYLCIERLCAITVSLQKVFQILINSRNRVIFSGFPFLPHLPCSSRRILCMTGPKDQKLAWFKVCSRKMENLFLCI